MYMKLRTYRDTLGTDVDCGRPNTASNTCQENKSISKLKAHSYTKRTVFRCLLCLRAKTAAPCRACGRGRGGAPVRVRFGVLNKQAIVRYEAIANKSKPVPYCRRLVRHESKVPTQGRVVRRELKVPTQGKSCQGFGATGAGYLAKS